MARVSIMRRVAWGIVGLLVLAVAGPQAASASTCHAPGRPTLGLQAVGFVPPRATEVSELARALAPRFRPVPCSDDPAIRPDHSSHVVGWFVPTGPGLEVLDLGPTPAFSADPPPFLDPPARLERPPRPA